MRKAEKLYHKYANDYYKTRFGIAQQAKCIFFTAAKCTYCRSKTADCKIDSSKSHCLINGLLGKSNGENRLPIRSSDFQLANKFSEYFLLKVKHINDMFENIPASFPIFHFLQCRLYKI